MVQKNESNNPSTNKTKSLDLSIRGVVVVAALSTSDSNCWDVEPMVCPLNEMKPTGIVGVLVEVESTVNRYLLSCASQRRACMVLE
jgi:hypothetical protein